MIQQHIQNADISEQEIDLFEFFSLVWKSRLFIISVTFVFSLFSIAYVMYLPNVYKAEVLLAPADQNSGSLPGQLGSLAALAGVNVGGKSGVDKTTLALEILKSHMFLNKFIAKHVFLPDIMASKSWDMAEDKIFYDDEIYNVETKEWVREVELPKTKVPSQQESIIAFLKSLKIDQDESSGMINISITHYSPKIAQSYLVNLVFELNEEMRGRDKIEAENSIKYLNEQIATVNYSEVKLALYSLIEEQTKALMLANVRSEYAFKVIDAPLIPEEKASPARALICIIITLIGLFISVVLVVIRFSVSNSKKNILK